MIHNKSAFLNNGRDLFYAFIYSTQNRLRIVPFMEYPAGFAKFFIEH